MFSKEGEVKGIGWSVLLLVFVLIAPSAGRAQSVNVEAAKKEGKVIVYGSVVPQAIEDFHKGFESK